MIADPCIGNRSSYQLSAPKASELRYLSYQHDQAITVGHINARISVQTSKLYGDFEKFALCELIVSPDFHSAKNCPTFVTTSFS